MIISDLDITFVQERCVPEPNSGCWLWERSTFKTGYGKIHRGGRTLYAHRVAYSLTHGALLGSSDFVCHRCDVRCCVNPDHLFLGDALANSQDMIRKGRQADHFAVNPRGEAHGMAKLTAATVREIRAVPAGRGAGAALARRFRVSESTVSKLRKGRGWSCADANHS